MKVGTLNVDEALAGLTREQIQEYKALAILDGWYWDVGTMNKPPEPAAMTPEEHEAMMEAKYG